MRWCRGCGRSPRSDRRGVAGGDGPCADNDCKSEAGEHFFLSHTKIITFRVCVVLNLPIKRLHDVRADGGSPDGHVRFNNEEKAASPVPCINLAFLV